MLINFYDVTPKVKEEHRAKYAPIVREFMRSRKQAISFTFDNDDEARKCYGAVRTYCDRHELPAYAKLNGKKVFCIKIEL